MTGAVSLFVAFLLGEMFIPTYTVRCFIARDARQARLGVAGSGLFLLLFLPIATCVLGLSAAAHPEVQRAAAEGIQQVFPALVRTTFHPAFAGEDPKELPPGQAFQTASRRPLTTTPTKSWPAAVGLAHAYLQAQRPIS